MAAQLDIEHLRTLIAIAEMGSFTGAAGVLGKTQAAVSIQMRSLEERIGRDIFTRESRSSRLTELGQQILAHARKMVVLSDETLAAFEAHKAEGSVCLGIPSDYADKFLPGILTSFYHANPAVEVSVTMEPSHRLAELIRTGHIDVAIVTSSHAGNVSVLRREPLCWVGAEHSLFDRHAVLPLALGPTTCWWRAAAVEALVSIGREYRVVYTSDSAAVQVAAVLAGLAVTVQPGSCVRQGTRVLSEAEGFPQLAAACEIGFIRSWQRPATSAVDALVHCIGAYFRSVDRG
jgi:DNA-binding transcriptional LysR family regulator